MADAFLAYLHERVAGFEALRKSAGKEERLIIKGLIGLTQSIIAEYEQLTAAPKRDDRKRRRVWARAKAFALSPVSEIHVTQGEQEARLIVHYLDVRGVAAEVVKRGEKWIVRKTKGESE